MTEPSPEDPMFDYATEKVAEDEQDTQKKKEKVADILIRLATGAHELFHTPDGTGYAIIPISDSAGDHLETWPIRSRGFRRWLAREFFTENKSAPNSDAIQSALNVIEARAHFDGRERAVYVRVGAHDGSLYLDLADTRWRAIEIDGDGWRIVDHAPIPFRRAAGMLTLPEPVHGGSINELRKFLNVNENDDQSEDSRYFVLSVAFVLAALRERGPAGRWPRVAQLQDRRPEDRGPAETPARQERLPLLHSAGAGLSCSVRGRARDGQCRGNGTVRGHHHAHARG